MRAELEQRSRRNAREVFFAAAQSARLNTAGTPAKWGREKRRIARGESPLSQDEPIKFDFDVTPWAEEPCRECVSPDVQTTVLFWGSGMGKTLGVFANVLGWTIDERPCQVLWALKTQGQMDEISKKQIAPFIAANPSVSSKVASPKSRSSGNTIQNKLFAGGALSMIGTESITGFRANRSPVVIADEVDSWEGEVGGEGDPLWLMLRRSDGFPRSIRMIASTPGTKGRSRIEDWYLRSDQRKWLVPCRSCGALQLITWAQIKWPKDQPRKAEWLCQECGAAHSDRQRRESVRAGAWRPTAPFNGIRGYWINGLNSLLPPNQGFDNRLHQWAKEVSDVAHAQDPKLAKKVIVQTLFTETWQDDEDAKPEWKPLFERREVYAKLPNSAVMIIAGSDVQADRIELEIVAIGRGEETWGVEHIILYGDTKQPEIYGRLESHLLRTWQREDGSVMRVRAFGLDTGFAGAQRQCYEFIRPRQARNWFALKGSSIPDAPVIDHAKKSKVERVRLLTVGTNRIKGFIYDRAAIAPAPPGAPAPAGYMHFPQSYTEDWFKQLLSEASYPAFKNGTRFRQFKKIGNERNEALDMRVYALGAFYALGPVNWDYEERQLQKTQVTAEKSKPKPSGNRFVGAGQWRI